MGAALGQAAIAPHWYKPFGDTMRSYLAGHPRFSLADVLQRYANQAERMLSAAEPMVLSK